MNLESTAQQVCTLFHAPDAQAYFVFQIVYIESNALIAHHH
jgi:hypothetical protein